MYQPTKNPASLAGQNGASKHVHTQSASNSNNLNTPVTLTQSELTPIICNLRESANQERRFVELLATNPLVPTKKACRTIACVNLSDLRQRTAKLLKGFGLEARCISPAKPIRNAYSETTNQKLWALYRIGGGS